MVKLNNKGFGMSTLIAFIAIFVLVIIGIMILAHNSGVDNSSNLSNKEVSVSLY